MTAVVTVNTRRGKGRVVDFDAVTLRQELNRKGDRDEVQRSLPRHEHYTPSAGWAKRLMISWPIDQWTIVPTEDWAHLIPAHIKPDVVDKRGVCWKAHDGFAKVTPARGVIGTECSMNTIFADDFARAFLTRFFQGEPAGDILLALRRRYLEQGNPLALAYTLYCDADLRLSKRLLPVDSSLASPVN